MADSGEETVAERPAKRQKRFTFQRFSQRVAQVPNSAITIALRNVSSLRSSSALHAFDNASYPSCCFNFAQCQGAALSAGGRRCIPSTWQRSPRALTWIHLFLSGGPDRPGNAFVAVSLCLTLRFSSCRSKLLSVVSSIAQRSGWQLQAQSILFVSLCPCYCIIR